MFVRIYLKPIVDVINFVTIVEASNIIGIIYAILMPAMFFRSRTRFSGTKVTTLVNGALETDVYFENFNKMLEGSYKNQDSRQNRV
uniref:Uncharacterized protein n=1 Tax=Acrobeloides nanus TaxID=290746 RepID=A0A914DRF8_9BILA